VVSSARYCGISELLVHGSNALILEDPLDAHMLAESVSQLLPDSALSIQLSQSGCVFAEAHTSSEVAARQDTIYSLNLLKV
jgi:hypothetical protein